MRGGNNGVRGNSRSSRRQRRGLVTGRREIEMFWSKEGETEVVGVLLKRNVNSLKV